MFGRALAIAKVNQTYQAGLQKASATQTAQATSKMPIFIGIGVIVLLLAAMGGRKRWA